MSFVDTPGSRQIPHIERVTVSILVGDCGKPKSGRRKVRKEVRKTRLEGRKKMGTYEVESLHGVPAELIGLHLEDDFAEGSLPPDVVQDNVAVGPSGSEAVELDGIEGEGEDGGGAPIHSGDRVGSREVPEVHTAAAGREGADVTASLLMVNPEEGM
jgi:hypothetical protein